MKKLIFLGILSLNALAYGMQGNQKADATLFQLMEMLGSDFQPTMQLLKRKLTPEEALIIKEEQIKEQEKAKILQESHRKEQERFRADAIKAQTEAATKQRESDNQKAENIALIQNEANKKIAEEARKAAEANEKSSQNAYKAREQEVKRAAIDQATQQMKLDEQKKAQEFQLQRDKAAKEEADRVREEEKKEAEREKAKAERKAKELAEYNDQLVRKREQDKREAEIRAKEEEAKRLDEARKKQAEHEKKLLEQKNKAEKEALELKAKAEKEAKDLAAKAHAELIERNKKADEERLARETKANEERLRQEIEAAKFKAKADAEKEKEVAEHKVEMLKDQSKREVLIEQAKRESELRTQENVAGIQTKIGELKKAFFEFTDNPERRKAVGKFIGLTTVGTIGGVLVIKNVLPIARQWVENRLFTPQLIEESSYSPFGSWFARKKKDVPAYNELYFDDALKQRVDEIKITLKKTKKNKGYYLNYLFYGLPGTGKTAAARALAYDSGMDFAFMTGGSVLDLLRSGKAIQRLKEVFAWAKKSPKGLLLFIDEADAFLGNPTGVLRDELNAMIKAFLNYTGTESKNVCVVISTNLPNVINKAVISRIGYRQQLCFDVASVETRKKIVAHFVHKYLGKYLPSHSATTGAIETMVNYIAEQTQGFSGRDLSYLVLGIEKAALASTNPKIDQDLIEKVVGEAVAGYNQAQNFVSYA